MIEYKIAVNSITAKGQCSSLIFFSTLGKMRPLRICSLSACRLKHLKNEEVWVSHTPLLCSRSCLAVSNLLPRQSSGQAQQLLGLQSQCSPACSRERAPEPAARSCCQQQQQQPPQQHQKIATEQAYHKGVFHARAAQKPQLTIFACWSQTYLMLICSLPTSFYSPTFSSMHYLLSTQQPT